MIAPWAMGLAWVAVVVTAACGGDTDPTPPVTGLDRPLAEFPVMRGSVVTYASFARVVDKARNIANGLDIDGRESGPGEALTCFKPDFVDPEDRRGIDNQFGVLLPIIESQVGTENIGQLLAAAIANGQLLLVMGVEGLDDPVNDDAVTLKLGAGTGKPMLDTAGRYIPHQTFGFNLDEAPMSTLPGRIENGTLYLDAPSAVLPVRVLDADFNMNLTQVKARFAVRRDAAGGISFKGIIGGVLQVAQFKEIVQGLTISDEVEETALFVVGSLADIDPDENGECRGMTAAIEIETTPAYVLPPATESPAPSAPSP